VVAATATRVFNVEPTLPLADNKGVAALLQLDKRLPVIFSVTLQSKSLISRKSDDALQR